MWDYSKIRKLFIGIAFVEVISLLVFYVPFLQVPTFIALCGLFLFYSLKDLKIGLLIIFIELIIGSKGGYLFFLDIEGTRLSIRIAFWLILMSVWFAKFFISSIKEKRVLELKIVTRPWFKYIGIFVLFVLWGLVNAFLRGNEYSNIFFDFNAYLFFLYIFPIISVIVSLDKKSADKLYGQFKVVLIASVSWLSLKTLSLLFLFAHKLDFLNTHLYKWIRDTGVGEITQVKGGFYRIFFQSHIFIEFTFVILLVFLLVLLAKKKNHLKNILKDKIIIYTFIFLILTQAVNIVSMSRSNWVGLIVSLMFIFLFSFWKYRFRGVATLLSLLFSTTLICFLLIIFIVKFPYPHAIGGFETGDILSERASDISEEAGVSSRWNLLPNLMDKIDTAPFLGQGFGTTVTYISNDPRVRSQSIDGLYTTFAFEWGWLDTWLKLGFLGVASLIIFIFSFLMALFRNFKKDDIFIYFSFFTIIVSLSAINFFSPYLNHPLGIGILLYIIFIFEIMSLKSERA